MITSDNPFLIRAAEATLTEKKSENEWLITVAERGRFDAEFLQTTADLKVTVMLSGKGAECHLKCAYLCNGDNRINVDFKVIHNSPETTSVQTIRGLATDMAHVTFNGTITIPHHSQKCDGHQNHRGIVLSDTADITATPQLEIWADDVKCAHGSAIGPLNTNQIFYLQTRGISEPKAKELLLASFFSDLMGLEFHDFIQNWLRQHVSK